MIDNIETFFAQYQPKPLHVTKEYAVLIPIIKVDGIPHLLYEVRSQHISQPGDTSFPGGRVEPNETFEEAAVRETVEELQIPIESIHVLGAMDYIVQNNRVIHSVLAEIKGIDLLDIIWNEEVEEIYTVPIQYFIDNEPDHYTVLGMMKYPPDFPYDRIPNGKQYNFGKPKSTIPFYNLSDHYLWGFTASLTERLIHLIKENKLFDSKNE